MNWKDYEKEVHQYFLQMYPEAIITYDAEIIGRYSKVARQIDVLIEDDVAGFPVKIVVDAKCFSRKIDVKCVESFISMVEDVDASQGLLVTQKGYSKAAINRAHYGPHKLELDVLNFEDVLRHQGLEAVPYSGKKSLLISAPFGWIIDASKQSNYLASFYQRGLTLEKAQKSPEWMYFNIWHKDRDITSINKLVEHQNKVMNTTYTNLQVIKKRSPKRNDGRDTYIRIASWKEITFKEITGYIDCDNFIAFFVMFTIEELENRNLRKLAHVLKNSIPIEIEFDNTTVIEELKNRCDSITDIIEKADAYRQLADWYMEMKANNKAMEYRRLSWKTSPKIYENIKPLIAGELMLSNLDAAINYSKSFFDLDPENPTVMQDLLLIYENPEYRNTFEIIIVNLISIYHNKNEALGNIYIHYGMYLFNLEDYKFALKQFTLAKNMFESFNSEHYAITQIDNVINEILEIAKK